MGTFVYTPDFETLARVQGQWETKELLSQQGMFAADIDFAYSHATSPMKAVLDAIPETYHQATHDAGLELNIDVRVHELRKGQYPATPGWHCDAPQRETEFSDHGNKTEVRQSLVVNLSNQPQGVSNTVFLTHPIEISTDRHDQNSWRELDQLLGADLTQPHRHFSEDGELVRFSPYSPHCIQPSVRDGVRMFIRISQWLKPEGHTPGLTKSEQVYITTNGIYR